MNGPHLLVYVPALVDFFSLLSMLPLCSPPFCRRVPPLSYKLATNLPSTPKSISNVHVTRVLESDLLGGWTRLKGPETLLWKSKSTHRRVRLSVLHPGLVLLE